jgi:hypothetical protein
MGLRHLPLRQILHKISLLLPPGTHASCYKETEAVGLGLGIDQLLCVNCIHVL